MNGDCPSPPKRVVQKQAGVFEPSSVEKFDEFVRSTPPRHGWHGIDHHSIAIVGLLHRRETDTGLLLPGAPQRAAYGEFSLSCRGVM